MREPEAIRKHPLYAEYYDRLRESEKERKFCCHQMEHLLDVARIAYICNLEKNMGIRKEVIYGAALLHDIGKSRQYEEGIPHEKASATIAKIILEDLPETYYSEEEKHAMLRAVLGHRREREDMEELERLLYLSDKRSRMCFDCGMETECNWSEEKKNLEITV